MFEELILKIKQMETEYEHMVRRLGAANKDLLEIRRMAYDVANVDSTTTSITLTKKCLNIETR